MFWVSKWSREQEKISMKWLLSAKHQKRACEMEFSALEPKFQVMPSWHSDSIQLAQKRNSWIKEKVMHVSLFKWPVWTLTLWRTACSCRRQHSKCHITCLQDLCWWNCFSSVTYNIYYHCGPGCQVWSYQVFEEIHFKEV